MYLLFDPPSKKEYAMQDYRTIIERLNLLPHPEGGYYRRHWQSDIEAEAKDSQGRIIHPIRSIGSSILYLLPSHEVSAWHRVSCDEMWHFYAGSSLRILTLSSNNELGEFVLGNRLELSEMPQIIIPRSTWFCAEVMNADSYTFCGCTLWPSFSYADFDLADREMLIQSFPHHRTVIERIFEKSNKF